MTAFRIAGAACALAVAVLTPGCSPTEYAVERTIELYVNALQGGDRAYVARLSARYQDEVQGLEGPAAQQAFERFSAWFKGRWDALEEAKRTGVIEPSPDGIPLVRALGLGRGGYYQVHEVVTEDGTARARIEVQLGYHAIPFKTFPVGTRLYLMGVPLGRLERVVRGERPRRLEVLAKVELECRLERTNDTRHPTGWLVRGIQAVPETARSIEIEWR